MVQGTMYLTNQPVASFWCPAEMMLGIMLYLLDHGQHTVSTWSAHGQHTVSTWSAHGRHMVGTCCTCLDIKGTEYVHLIIGQVHRLRIHCTVFTPPTKFKGMAGHIYYS